VAVVDAVLLGHDPSIALVGDTGRRRAAIFEGKTLLRWSATSYASGTPLFQGGGSFKEVKAFMEQKPHDRDGLIAARFGVTHSPLRIGRQIACSVGAICLVRLAI